MKTEDSVQYIYADLIDDPVDAMRSDIDRDALFELSDDIKKNGLINPITVRPVGERFEVVAGHRRFTSCKMAAIVKIACVVRELSDEQVFNIKTAENLKREDVDPVDEGHHYLVAMEKLGKSVAEIADMVGRGTQYVSDRIAVAQMPDYLKEYLKRGEIKLGVALALVEITDDVVRRLWVDLAVRDGVSVRTAQYWFLGWQKDQLPGAVPTGTPPGEAPASEYKPPRANCAVDGKEYPMADCEVIFVFKGNLPVLKELRSGMVSLASEN